MAASLPAINPTGSRVGQSNMSMNPTGSRMGQSAISMTINQPADGKNPSSMPEATILKLSKDMPNRSQSKKDKEIAERRNVLRSQMPYLSKKQTAQYRNVYKHNLFVEMLSQGYHKSFAELFALIKEQNDRRLQAGPDSALWSMKMLENEPEKLNVLKTYLQQAEIALRKRMFGAVYKCQFKLARYFQGTGDKWLADHFFHSCLATTASVKGDDGKMEAEGHCNVGLAKEESGAIFEAMENFERFYELCKEYPEWELDGGKPMHPEACNHLSRIYTAVAAELDEEGQDMNQQITYLKKAYDMSKEGGDTNLAAEASYRLGVAHEKNNTPATALHYLMNYLETCRTLDDHRGVGKACEAIAKAYQKEEKIEESIKYLEMFLEIAERLKDDRAVSRACSSLGSMFNALSRYEMAVEYFNKSYNIARSLNDKEIISASRVHFGMAMAHKMWGNYSNHTEIANQICMERIIEWKDNRGDEFEKEIKEEASEVSPTSKIEYKPQDSDESKSTLEASKEKSTESVTKSEDKQEEGAATDTQEEVKESELEVKDSEDISKSTLDDDKEDEDDEDHEDEGEHEEEEEEEEEIE